MENFEDKTHLIDEAKQQERKMQSTIDSGEAKNFTEAQELVTSDELFGIDLEVDTDDIKRVMRLVQKNSEEFMVCNEWDYEVNKRYGWLKYSDSQVDARQWEEDDLKFAIKMLREERQSDYYGKVASQYETSAPITDSIVRLEQEAKIAETLRGNKPVLIRGNWRIGKTSMTRSLATHQFGLENSIVIDAWEKKAGTGESLDEFQHLFGLWDIARFIAEKDMGSGQGNVSEKAEEIREQIMQSQQTPFEFLNDYLLKRGEKVYLSLDEVMGFAEEPDKLKYLADLKSLKCLKLVIVLHRVASFEDLFKDTFNGYETHFMRALTIQEVGLVVRRPLEGTRITFSDDAIQRIFNFTGGRPIEINTLCKALMEPSSEHQNCKFTYRAEDIDALTSKESMRYEETFEVPIAAYKRVYKKAMSDEERLIIARLTNEGEVPIGDLDMEIIQPLIDTTFVTKDEDKGIYCINGELLKNAVLKPITG